MNCIYKFREDVIITGHDFYPDGTAGFVIDVKENGIIASNGDRSEQEYLVNLPYSNQWISEIYLTKPNNG